MAALPISSRQAMLAKVHIAGKQLGLDEETYRDAMERATGKRSAADCSDAELAMLVEHFSSRGFVAARKGRITAEGQAAKYLAKVRALWIAGWNLGVIADPSDKAMQAFIERQTRIAAARWLKDADDAGKVIEALKSWLEREGVVWREPQAPNWATQPGYRVAIAQWAKLVSLGVMKPGVSASGRLRVDGEGLYWYASAMLKEHGRAENFGAPEWAEVCRVLGRRIRKAMAEKES